MTLATSGASSRSRRHWLMLTQSGFSTLSYSLISSLSTCTSYLVTESPDTARAIQHKGLSCPDKHLKRLDLPGSESPCWQQHVGRRAGRSAG